MNFILGYSLGMAALPVVMRLLFEAIDALDGEAFTLTPRSALRQWLQAWGLNVMVWLLVYHYTGLAGLALFYPLQVCFWVTWFMSDRFWVTLYLGLAIFTAFVYPEQITLIMGQLLGYWLAIRLVVMFVGMWFDEVWKAVLLLLFNLKRSWDEETESWEYRYV